MTLVGKYRRRRTNLHRRIEMPVSATSIAPSENALLRIAPFVLMVFFIFLAIAMPLATLPLEIHDILGFGNVTVGIAVGLQSLVTLLTRQYAGTLCDRRGAKRSVLIGGILSVGAGAIYLVAASPTLGAHTALGILLAGRALSGVGESLVMTGALAWGIATVGGHHTGKVMVWVGIGMYAAIAAGAPLGIALMGQHGAVGGFAAVSIATMVAAALAAAPAVFIASVAPVAGERLPFYRVAGLIAPFGAGLALATVGFSALAGFAALDFQTKGWPGAGFVLGSFGVAYIATRMIFGGWPDRFGGARVAAGSLVVECAGLTLLWLAFHPALALAGAILTGIGFALVFPSFGIEAVKQVPPTSRGAAVGAYAAFFDVGIAVGGPVAGFIAGTFGYPAAFAAGALGTVLALAACRYARAGAAATP
jgi:MFS family permease